jgi:hypothetical protein
MPKLRNILRFWLPLALLTTLLSGLIYVVAQQAGRASANDPQIQLAEDAAAALAAGQPLDSLIPAAKVDIAASLAPYLIVFDSSGKAIAGSGVLHGELPSIPPGIFDYVRQHGEDRLTWQPEPGVRSATVVVGYGGSSPGFILAGRSLRQVEERDTNIMRLIGVGWFATLCAALAGVAVCEFIFGR